MVEWEYESRYVQLYVHVSMHRLAVGEGETAMLTFVVHRWVYLFFFNMLWVFIPLYVLYEAYGNMTSVFAIAEGGGRGKKSN